MQRWPTFQDVLDKARKLDVRGREAGWLSSTLRALASICFGDMGDLVNHPSAGSPEGLLDQTVILELDALSQSDKVFVASALLLWIHHRRMIEPTREQFKHAIVIEEAHHLLADERKSLVGGQSVMDITFREIREFGESVVILDQHPSQISLSALGNTFATISLNLKTSKDVSAMAQCMLLENEEKDILGSLEVGQAVVKLQGRVQAPFLIRIPQFQIVKGAVTDEMVRARMGMEGEHELQGISNQEHKLPAPPVPSLPSIALAKPETDDFVAAFLNDVVAHPECGIAERYKRLKISVRQGQKLKLRLLEAGMIEDHAEFTQTGRIRKIKLTSTGERFLYES